jgi:hypothetical protein
LVLGPVTSTLASKVAKCESTSMCVLVSSSMVCRLSEVVME